VSATYGVILRFFQALSAILALAGAAQARPLKVLAFGDSLTAGYNLSAAAAFPAQLEKRLRADGFDVVVTNAGVSGDTSAGGLERLDFALGDGADLVIVELGANDMLRGMDPAATKVNLAQILGKVREKGARPLIAGMTAAGNFGPDYKKAFDAVFPDLARETGAPLYPFFLEGVAGDAKLSLGDGMHPNADGVARIVKGLAPLVETTLRDLRAEK